MPAPTQETGIADLPNQRHKIFSRNGANFTLMVVGESGLGKTTFINTLFTTTIKDYQNPERRFSKQLDKTVDITIHKGELEEKQFVLRLNVVDTPGFGDYVNNKNSWLTLVDFIDSQYESVMRQEQQPIRAERIDMRVHACIFFIRPTGHRLKPLDIEAMKHISSRCNLIPVIGKADTLCSDDLERFKAMVRQQMDENGIKAFQIPSEEEDTEEATARVNDSLMAAMPFSIVGSDQLVVTSDNRRVKGREYPWGIVEVENPDHCDFIKLRDLLIRTHMLDLITTTEEVHYDNYRAKFLAGEIGPKSSQLTARFKEEEEQLRKRFTEQVKKEEQRFRQWESKLIAERDRLNRDLEQEHSMVKQLEAELDANGIKATRR